MQMIPGPTGVRVWLATGHTDMRKGFASLSLQVQEVLHRDPLCGHLFCFRGRRGNLLKGDLAAEAEAASAKAEAAGKGTPITVRLQPVPLRELELWAESQDDHPSRP